MPPAYKAKFFLTIMRIEIVSCVEILVVVVVVVVAVVVAVPNYCASQDVIKSRYTYKVYHNVYPLTAS